LILDCISELEDDEEHVINWSVEITETLGSRLYALWNRTAGDCLLDSVLQASWGIMDRDNTLRRALADSLHEAGLT
jgi:ubiquitin thioesterase ZRANB1